MSYQGWTNYETWIANLWLSNDESSSDYWRERAQEIRKDARENPRETWTQEETARFNLADALKDSHEEGAEDITADSNYPNVYGDLLRGALASVSWNEIATAKLDELD